MHKNGTIELGDLKQKEKSSGSRGGIGIDSSDDDDTADDDDDNNDDDDEDID